MAMPDCLLNSAKASCAAASFNCSVISVGPGSLARGSCTTGRWMNGAVERVRRVVERGGMVRVNELRGGRGAGVDARGGGLLAIAMGCRLVFVHHQARTPMPI